MSINRLAGPTEGRVEPLTVLLQRLGDYYLARDAANSSSQVAARPSGRELPSALWG